MFRIVRLSLLLALLLALPAATPVYSHGERVSCEELRDQPGSDPFLFVGSYMSPTMPGYVRGCDFKPREKVTIRAKLLLWDGGTRVLTRRAVADAHGAFGEIPLDDTPMDVSDSDSVRGYKITVTGNKGSSASYNLGDKPSIRVNPRGELGGEPPMVSCNAYYLTGYGFRPGEKVHVEATVTMLSGRVVELEPADVRAGRGVEEPPDFNPLGYFVSNAIYKGDSADLAGGTVKALATGDKGSRASVTQEPRPCVDVQVAAPGNPTFRVAGHNFRPGERVRIQTELSFCDASPVQRDAVDRQADTGGSFEVGFRYGGDPSDLRNAYTFWVIVKVDRGVVYDAGSTGRNESLQGCEAPQVVDEATPPPPPGPSEAQAGPLEPTPAPPASTVAPAPDEEAGHSHTAQLPSAGAGGTSGTGILIGSTITVVLLVATGGYLVLKRRA